MSKSIYDMTIDKIGNKLKKVSGVASTSGDPPAYQTVLSRGDKQDRKESPNKEKTATTKKKKAKKVVEYVSDSSDNGENLSFVDEEEDEGEEEENPFVKGTRHYSTSRQRKRHVMSSSNSDDDDEDDEESTGDSARDGRDHVFKRPDGKELRYARDEFVQLEDSSEDRLEKQNARRLARGQPLLRLESDESDSPYEGSNAVMALDEGEDESSDDGEEKSEDAGSSAEAVSMEEDETREILADARHIIKMHRHRVRPVDRARPLTKRTVEVIELEKALFKEAEEVDSEADTVDGKAVPAPSESSDDDDDDDEENDEDDDGTVNSEFSALAATQACLDKIYKVLDVTHVDGTPMTNPLDVHEMAGLYEAMKTLSAVHLNAAIEQQKSKNIQAHINQGHSIIPGQSASRDQSENVQESLHFLDGFMKKDAILNILERAVEDV